MAENWVLNVVILPTTGAHHWPINLCINTNGTILPRPFKFEKFWLHHPNFAKNIKKWWGETTNMEGTVMYHSQQHLNKIKEHLKMWNKTVFGDIHQAKKDLERKMEILQQEIILHGRTETTAET